MSIRHSSARPSSASRRSSEAEGLVARSMITGCAARPSNASRYKGEPTLREVLKRLMFLFQFRISNPTPFRAMKYNFESLRDRV